MSEERSKQQTHKSGPLKQHNKSHKNGRHRSKGEISSAHKGRVGVKVHTQKGFKEVRKADRRNQQKQLRANKRHEALSSKRKIGVSGHPPHLVVVIPLSDTVDLEAVHSLLCRACDMDDPVPISPLAPPTLISSSLKHRFTLLYPSTSNLYALLDVAKVADALLLVHKAQADVSSHCGLLLDCCIAQGLPTTLHLAQGLGSLTGRSLNAAKKAIERDIEARFPKDKLLQIDTPQNAKTVLRVVSTHKRQQVLFRDQHSHLLVDKLCFSPYGCAGEGEEDRGTLLLSGYVRAKPLSVNSLLHIPGLGDFQMKQIDSPRDPNPFTGGGRQSVAMAVDTADDEMEEDVKVLEIADPAKQVSLESEVVPNPMEGEQTWPSEEELQKADAARSEKRVAKRVPKGTSKYQAAWIIESDTEHGGDDSDMEEEEEEGTYAEGEGLTSEEEELEDLCSDTNVDTMTLPDTDLYDADFDADAEEKQLQRLRAERDHFLFPDEVDTPTHIAAHTRFQKFRGLRSFRTSPWDPKENLPSDYARIFQFENFNRTKKCVFRRREEEEGALPGWYVTLHVSNVPSNFAERVSSPLVVYCLLPHENKMSVVHFVLRRAKNYTLPIKSKDSLVFHTGVRRFSAGSIFSQHSPGTKHKFERFFPSKGCGVASVYAPIGYPPQSVLVFHHQQLQGGGERAVLVATGTLYRVDPQRIICKRIILSGHPFKINKHSAVIRYMFFNREDILWFKPVELKTKYGRRGHIKEPLGTHGHMKCVFDGQLKAQDTVLMCLYKRVYPKWVYNSNVPTPQDWSSAPAKSQQEPDVMEQ